MTAELSVGIIPVFKEGNDFLFLLVQHANGGHWAFPKGHKDAGETDEQTARREVLEETGISDIKIVPNIILEERYTVERSGNHKTVRYFIGITKDKKVIVQADEIADFAWLPYDEALEQLTYPEAKNLLRRVDLSRFMNL